jgi:hypothetical protein
MAWICSAKNSLVTLNTTGLSSSSATRFGIAIIAFSVSATSQTKSSLIIAPTGIAATHRMRNGMMALTPNRYSTQRSP